MYGGLAFAGHVICSFTGVNLWGGFDLSPEVIMTGFGYAVPPMMALLFILEVRILLRRPENLLAVSQKGLYLYLFGSFQTLFNCPAYS